MSDVSLYANSIVGKNCFSWFNLNDIPNGDCNITFCKVPSGNCVGECIDIFVANRNGTIEIGDKIYILENGNHVLLPAGKYVSSVQGIHFVIDGSGTLINIVNCSSESVTIDIDGNYYATIEINGLVWFKENLRTTSYSDGSPIPNIDGDWVNDIEGGYAAYPDSCFGFLYNWYAVDNPKGLCPTGWRVPTADDFRNLINAYGGVLKAGQALKVDGDVWWENTNLKTTNTSGFSAYPSGSKDFKGNFEYLGSRATFWSSTTDSCEVGVSNALQLYCCGIYTNTADVQCDDKKNGYAIRCVRN